MFYNDIHKLFTKEELDIIAKMFQLSPDKLFLCTISILISILNILPNNEEKDKLIEEIFNFIKKNANKKFVFVKCDFCEKMFYLEEDLYNELRNKNLSILCSECIIPSFQDV